LTPETLAEIAKTAGIPAAILLYMWINRAPTPKEKREDPAERILQELRDLRSDIHVLLDRTTRK